MTKIYYKAIEIEYIIKEKVYLMRCLDIAVVGSGIGGSLIASLSSQCTKKDVVLFEKDKNLGGCASTFTRFGNRYNTGATTLVGYEQGHILKEQFDAIGLQPDISKSEIAIRVIQNNKSIDRVKDFDTFLESINTLYPNPKNTLFWSRLKELDEIFWRLKNIYYVKYSLQSYVKIAFFVAKLVSIYGSSLFKSAESFINETLGNISLEYRDFIDSQLLITIQTTSKEISLLSLALGLSYPFHDVFYVNGGMGTLIQDIVKDIEVKKNETIVKVLKDSNDWIIRSTKDEYRVKNLILNASIYQNSTLFEDKEIKKYYNHFSFSDQSAFVVYLIIDTEKEFLEHYQFIYEKLLPNSISKSFFVSFSKQSDAILSKKGLSVTISTHTKAMIWKNMEKVKYEYEKQRTQDYIIKKFLEYFTTIKQKNILKCFSATSATFNRYIGRTNCGGKAIHMKNLTQLPSCKTPFKGLYNVGDTIFAGQGWPGVALGVDVLSKEINASS